jgi:hypothetical protein
MFVRQHVLLSLSGIEMRVLGKRALGYRTCISYSYSFMGCHCPVSGHRELFWSWVGCQLPRSSHAFCSCKRLVQLLAFHICVKFTCRILLIYFPFLSIFTLLFFHFSFRLHPLAFGGRYSDSLRAGRSEVRTPLGGGARFSAPVQAGPGAHQASCTVGVKRPGRDVNHSFHLTPSSKKEYNYTSSPSLGLHGLL